MTLEGPRMSGMELMDEIKSLPTTVHGIVLRKKCIIASPAVGASRPKSGAI
jgi:hypothetical protein